MKRIPSLLAIVLLLAALTLMTAGSQESEAGSEPLEPEQTADGYKLVSTIDMTVAWKVVGDELEIELTAPTRGWLAVGFDPTQVMKDADIYIGHVAENGTVAVRDDYANWFTSHEPDENLGGTSDVTVIEGDESDSGTRIRFRIPLDSGDQFDNPLTPGDEHVVIVAYGEDDGLGRRHRDRAKFTVSL